MTRGVLAKTEPSRRCQISLFGARQKRLHQPTTGCCTHEARRKNSTLSVASLTGKKGARHAFGVDDEDDSPFVAGLKAWFMGWVSFSRAHLPKSGSFLMSAEEPAIIIVDNTAPAIATQREKLYEGGGPTLGIELFGIGQPSCGMLSSMEADYRPPNSWQICVLLLVLLSILWSGK